MLNPGLPAIAFIEGSAILILLVLYWLLAKGFTARFFRYWLYGWAAYAVFGVVRVFYASLGGSGDRLILSELSFVAAGFFLAAVLEYTGKGRRLEWLWPLGILWTSWLAAQAEWLRESSAARWVSVWFESALYLIAGWLLWRSRQKERGHGVILLAAALLLQGLHSLDRLQWPAQTLYPLRVSFAGLLEVAMGVAMAVVVLEAGRTRTEDLNEKLRRLTLITAAATQSFRVDEVLGRVLRHLVDSLGASHGLVRLLDGQGEGASLVVRAAVGFSSQFLERNARVLASEPWAKKVLEQKAPYLICSETTDNELRRWMESEQLAALVLVRLPGSEKPLGILGIGSRSPRRFLDDEVNFLVNVANLLGLTIQNVWLYEQIATAQREWAYTFDSIGDLILVHDQECRVVRVNRRLAERLAGDASTLIGRPLREVLAWGERRWSHCPYCEEVAGSTERRDPSFGGYFLATNSDLHDAGGEWLGTVHVLKDFTERKEAESKYRTLFENVQEGVFVSTPEGRFLDFNHAFMRLVGYESREELMKVEIAPALYADPRERERLKRLLRDHGEVTNFEFQFRRRDGEIRTATESSFASRNAAGDVVAYQGFILDVTERKRAEQEIRRRNRELMALNSIAQTLGQSLELTELLRQVLCQVVDLFAIDVGSIYLVDEASGSVRRVASSGFRSEYARSFPPTTVSKKLLQHIRQVRATILSGTALPLPAVFRDLQEKEGIEVCHVAILWSKDRIMGALAAGFREVREFSAAELNLLAAVANQIAMAVEKALLLEETRRAYENLRHTQQQLLHSEKMAAVGQLISGVAHELNNPLTAILGYSQLLSSEGHVSPTGAEYVEKLRKQAQRTHHIVHSLLSFARQHKPERLPVRVNQILEDTLVLREYDLKLNNIRVHRDFDPQLPVTAGDSHQLQQVFLNVLNNSVDAVLEVADPREIWVRTRKESGRLVVEFLDSGPGVKDPLRVFDPFYTTKPVGKGTGLGLSICYGIVKEHGGDIQVRNAPPRGACFTISMPILPVTAAPEVVAAPAESGFAVGRVLLVDDEDAVLELEQEILKGCGLAVFTARSGREALEVLERQSVDVLVTDLKMPGEISGQDLFGWIERHRPELAAHVVFTMSNPQEERVQSFLKRSGCLFVQKPFPIEDFLGSVRKALDRRPAAVRR